MKNIFFSLLICLLAATSCSKKNTSPDQRSVEYFIQNVKADMTYSNLTTTFGNPDADNGSGIHIYVYKLKDATSIWIGFTDRIMYVKQVDGNNQVIRTIL